MCVFLNLFIYFDLAPYRSSRLVLICDFCGTIHLLKSTCALGEYATKVVCESRSEWIFLRDRNGPQFFALISDLPF